MTCSPEWAKNETVRLLRYLVALAAWLVLVAGDALLRVVFLPFLPVVWLRSLQSQNNAQLMANLSDFYTRPFMRLPRLRRRYSPGGRAMLLQEVGNDRI